MKTLDSKGFALRTSRKTLLWGMLALAVAAVVIAGCGKSSSGASLKVSAAESGKTVRYTAPSSTKGGLLKVTFTNHGKSPHVGQLVRIQGGHTAKDALKVLVSNSPKTPQWLRAEGGPELAVPGRSAEATVLLPAGKYLVGDFNGMTKNPGYAQFTVTPGKSGKLPSTSTTITAANPSKDHYKWQLSGSLKSGTNKITFASKGKNALHFVAAARVSGHHTNAQLVKALSANGPPPKYVDQKSFTNTSVLDGGKSQVTTFEFSTPGTYVLFCPFTDRDGGKPHFKEGLLTQVTVK